jgi:hypothetical protein
MIDGFVARYATKPEVDGLPPGEGAFLPCNFWLADNVLPIMANFGVNNWGFAFARAVIGRTVWKEDFDAHRRTFS